MFPTSAKSFKGINASAVRWHLGLMLVVHALYIISEATSFHLGFFVLQALYAYLCYFSLMTLN